MASLIESEKTLLGMHLIRDKTCSKVSLTHVFIYLECAPFLFRYKTS